MYSPKKPGTKETMLPNTNLQGMIMKDNQSKRSIEDLVQDSSKPAYIGTNPTSEPYHDYPDLNRLPTLYEVLNRRTQEPVDLWSFYTYMRDYQNSVDYIDFWMDVITHLRLCKDYVRGLRESLLITERTRNSSSQDKLKPHLEDDLEDDEFQFVKAHKAENARASVSSSLLLEALINDGFLDERDNRRVSAFLQGNEYVNVSDSRLSQMLQGPPTINPQDSSDEANEKTGEKLNTPPLQHQMKFDSTNTPPNHYEPLQTPNRAFTGEYQTPYDTSDRYTRGSRNSTRVLPEQVESYVANSKKGQINREKLKQSSQNILNTYFQDGAPKRLNVPDRIVRKLKHDIEFQGRDDPEVFDDARNYVYSVMERECHPFFLEQYAIHNINNRSILLRLIGGLFSLFAAFWIAYSLIFIDIKPKAIRAVLIIPFLIAFYLIVSVIYKVDPIMVFLGYCDDPEFSAEQKWVSMKKKIREPFVKGLLRRRASWVGLVILLVTAVFSILFGLVPGHRL
ncbi:hypothetical protein WICPIJ_003572 [Wickerhamomyces pijperi]|uniref:RGS domain-containing protein n=1 Tax=Wickerhamomyces pijperi TaxID=599730 RepID=A0A9P8Q6W4_WICPI|nr:hypothetical protein WICPIJ_003572 [Wickerhamomyces pijperi]